MTLRVAILGAGPAGLGLARQLLVRDDGLDVSVEVIEARTSVGGLTESFECGGVVFDHGSHRLHPSIDPEILAVLQDLLPGVLQERKRNGRIALGGRWVRFPLKPLDAAWHLPAGFQWGLLRDAVARRSQPAGETYASVLRAQLGTTLCEAFYFPFARKLWGCSPEEIDAEQARRRVAARSPWQIVTKMLRQVVGRHGAGTRFYYPNGGFGQIAEALAGDVIGRGGRLRTGTTVTSLERQGECWRIETGSEPITADRVFSTIPVATLARLLRPEPSTAVREAADGLRSRAVVLVCLVFGRDHWTAFDAHYVPRQDIIFSRISEPTHYSAARAVNDRTGICVEVPCDRNDATWEMSDEELRERVCRQIEELGLPAPEPLLASLVRRVPSVYPVYDLDYRSRLSVLEEFLGAQPSLVTLGRQGLFAHDNTHHTLAMAWAAAGCLQPDGSWDQPAWDAARLDFAGHVVED